MDAQTRLTSFLQSLDLLDPSDPPPTSPTSPTSFASIACTIAEELDPDFPSVPSDLESHLEPLLRRLGYTADPTEPIPVLSFLTSTLSTHRVLALRNARAKSPPDPRDAILAAAVSRLHEALPHPHRAAPEDPAQLAALIRSLSLAVEKRVALAGTTTPVFGDHLLEEEAIAREAQACQSVREELAREHELRKRLMLHRLEVTVRAFSQSKLADKPKFEAMMEGVRRLAQDQGQVSHYETVAAREWVLRPERLDTDVDEKGVKSVVMGNVPDRGGRIGRGSGAKMPDFRARLAPAVGHGKGKKDKDWKGKGGKRRRGRV